MKKRLIVTAIAVSLASGFLAFNRGEDKIATQTMEFCTDECCENGPQDCQPKCCEDTEMCCE